MIARTHYFDIFRRNGAAQGRINGFDSLGREVQAALGIPTTLSAPTKQTWRLSSEHCGDSPESSQGHG